MYLGAIYSFLAYVYEFVLSKHTVMKIEEKICRGILVAGIEVESILLRLFCNHLFRIEAHFQDRRGGKKKPSKIFKQSLYLFKLPLLFFCRNRTQRNAITALWMPNRDNSELISIALVSVNICSRYTDYSLNYHFFFLILLGCVCVLLLSLVPASSCSSQRFINSCLPKCDTF